VYDDLGKATLGNEGRPWAERRTKSRGKFEDIVIRQCPGESKNKIRGKLGAPPPTEESDQWIVIAKGLADSCLKGVDNGRWIPFRPLESAHRWGSCDGIVSGDYRCGARFGVALIALGTSGSIGVGLANWDDLVGIGVFGSEAHVYVDKRCF